MTMGEGMVNNLVEIYRYRMMMYSIVNKELRTRYRGSILGFFWTFINPLLQLVIYSLIFPHLLKFQIDNYALFMFVCLIPWIFFNTSVVGSCNIILNNSNIVTKIYFPRVILPISYTLSGLVNMLLSFLIVIPMLYYFKISPTLNLLWLILIFFILLVMSMGFAMFFSAINVYFRDIEHILGIFMLGFYFFTPILYSLDMFNESWLKYFEMNPLTNIMLSIRDVTMYGKGPDLSSLIYPSIFSIVIFCFGYIVFQKLQRRFAEVI